MLRLKGPGGVRPGVGALATEQVMQEDEELFKHYTAVCMEEWKGQGKDLKPMMLELTKRNKVTF